MRCPFRKNTTYKYTGKQTDNGLAILDSMEESFGACYGDDCPFYYKDDEDNDCCDRCGSYGEGDDI